LSLLNTFSKIHGTSLTIQTGDTQELTISKTVSTGSRVARTRLIGNLLMVAGLVMLLVIGGWYGYTWYSNEQFLREGASRGLVIEPTVLPGMASQDVAAVEPQVPLPAPRLLTGKPAGAGGPVPEVEPSAPTRIEIPSVAIDSEVVTVTWAMLPSKDGVTRPEWQVADFAVGYHNGSSYPGRLGNVVMSGHVDYKGEVFRDLHKVNKGDQVIVHTAKGQYMYVVESLVLVREEGVSDEERRRNAEYMKATPDQTLTLITCWPYGIDTHRLIVIAKPYQSSLSAQSEFIIR
jgi:sortase A